MQPAARRGTANVGPFASSVRCGRSFSRITGSPTRFIRLCTEPRAAPWPLGVASRELTPAQVRPSTTGVADARLAHPELHDQARRAPVLGGHVRDGAPASPGESLIELDSPSAL